MDHLGSVFQKFAAQETQSAPTDDDSINYMIIRIIRYEEMSKRVLYKKRKSNVSNI